MVVLTTTLVTPRFSWHAGGLHSSQGSHVSGAFRAAWAAGDESTALQVMELLEGPDLFDFLATRSSKLGEVQAAGLVRYLGRVVSWLTLENLLVVVGKLRGAVEAGDSGNQLEVF